MTYTIGGYTAGSSHTITLYFEEDYFDAAGDREFNLAINGTSELSNFDIYATAGAEFTAIQKVYTLDANSSGQYILAFTTGAANEPMVNGISIQ
jgi:beta-galactosidase